MKTILPVATLLSVTVLLAGCGVPSQPMARALIAAHDHESGEMVTSDVIDHVNTEAFVNAATAHAGVSRDASMTIKARTFRDTTLVELIAVSSSESDALALASASIAVLTEHFNTLAEQHQMEQMRVVTSRSEDQEMIEVTVAEGIDGGRPLIDILEPPHVVER